MKPLTIILLLLISLVATPASAQQFDAPPTPQVVAAARMVTVSWHPGSLKGFSQDETQRIIVEALQQWQSVSGVRFGTLPAGNATDITLYPYTQSNPPWAMATYPSTGQILYATTKKFDRDWAVMAFAHEIAHVFGWGHADKSRLESMMHPNGSSVRYFDVTDAKRARNQFGLSSVGYHWPYSLKFVGDKIRAEQKVFDKAKSDYTKHDATWEKKNGQFEYWKQQRAIATTKERRELCNKNVQSTLKSRDAAGANRAKANSQIAASNKQLTTLSNQWNRIKREWDSINGIVLPPVARSVSDEPCSCFHDDRQEMRSVNLRDLFKDLPKDTQPLELAL